MEETFKIAEWDYCLKANLSILSPSSVYQEKSTRGLNSARKSAPMTGAETSTTRKVHGNLFRYSKSIVMALCPKVCMWLLSADTGENWASGC